ncbi:MAG: hypothetical protein HYX21_02530 [Candidatus Yanofskybacteria bacterium]|nr:hypothetical protein [Candidatus Yanofskybacteria bacterium]
MPLLQLAATVRRKKEAFAKVCTSLKKKEDKKKVKYYVILIGIGLGFLLFLDLFTLGSNIFNLKKIQTTEFKRTAEVRISGQTGETRTFSGEVVENMTVLDALLAAAQSANFNVDYLIANGELDIRLINGLPESPVMFWNVYLNGAPISIKNLNSLEIENGDLVEFKLKPVVNENK